MHAKRTGRLSLTPVGADLAPQRDAVLTCLQDLELIADSFAADDSSFLIGEGFLRHISFMGCSPHIELAPPEDGSAFCHVRIEGPLAEPALRVGDNAQPPRCPSCRARLGDWREQVSAWQAGPLLEQVECGKCGRRSRPVDLVWRHSAGSGRLFVHIEDVFPSEAVPVPGLLQGLQKASGTPWDYFYTRD